MPEYAVAFIPERCIGCRACQVACQEWNGRSPEETTFSPSFTNPPDLTPDTWTVVRFIEVGGSAPQWLFLKVQCMHCKNAPCAQVCPAGAIEVHPEGAVVIREDKCIGCGFCMDACPFGVPRLDEKRGKAYKCTLCIDRLQNGLEPACVAACPTHALIFGVRDELIEKLRREGYEVYGEKLDGVGYTHWLYATRRYKGKLTDPQYFNLPSSVRASAIPAIRSGGIALAAVATAAVVAHAIYWRVKRLSEKRRRRSSS